MAVVGCAVGVWGLGQEVLCFLLLLTHHLKERKKEIHLHLNPPTASIHPPTERGVIQIAVQPKKP